MDEFEANVMRAWLRVFDRLATDPKEAARRARREYKAKMTRPPRAWCLALRSSDRRITEWDSEFEPARAAERGEAHTVKIWGEVIRRLCAPIRLDHDKDTTLVELANQLGRSVESLRRFLPIRPGRTREARAKQAPARYDEVRGKFFRLRYMPPAPRGHFGVDIPVVFTHRVLNPSGRLLEGPYQAWGSLWQTMAEGIPEEFTMTVAREPRMVPYRGGQRQRGWWWRCPGRLSAPHKDAAWRSCGRRCMILYEPMKVFTVGGLLGTGEGLEVRSGETVSGLGLSGRWHPGLMDPWAGLRSFACAKCWGVRNWSLVGWEGWNSLVTHISGGLLYGRDVVKPSWWKYDRKIAYKPRGKKGEAVARGEGVVVGKAAG